MAVTVIWRPTFGHEEVKHCGCNRREVLESRRRNSSWNMPPKKVTKTCKTADKDSGTKTDDVNPVNTAATGRKSATVSATTGKRVSRKASSAKATETQVSNAESLPTVATPWDRETQTTPIPGGGTSVGIRSTGSNVGECSGSVFDPSQVSKGVGATVLFRRPRQYQPSVRPP